MLFSQVLLKVSRPKNDLPAQRAMPVTSATDLDPGFANTWYNKAF